MNAIAGIFIVLYVVLILGIVAMSTARDMRPRSYPALTNEIGVPV